MIPVVGELRPWTDPTQLHINRLPMHTTPGPRTRTRRSLDGNWSFALFDHPDAVPPEAVTGATPPATGGWRPITVPGNWTMQIAEDLPHYTNVQMPFPGPPPALPPRNPTGVHRCSFDPPGRHPGDRLVLHVAGAESVHVVYLNDRFIGYGTDSRLPSEYDITDAVIDGPNQLAVVVIRYSAHSYVEDQDQWWMAGLHRTVFVETRPAVAIADVELAAEWDPTRSCGSLRVDATVGFADRPSAADRAGLRVRSWLETLDGAVIAPPIEGAVPHRFEAPDRFVGHRVTASWPDLEIEPWSAETPTLYRVRIELVNTDGQVLDTAAPRAGFRRVVVSERQLLVNGRPILIFGVNRHDHHPDRGKAVTTDDLRADLVAMRAHNINAIRTAHYPNDETFLDLCDELGFYVVDEANIECHAYNRSLCRDPDYRATWLDRGARMVQRDRNHPSVILWSLGNESGYGPNHDALAGWIRSADPSRPLHYEQAIAIEGWADGGLAATDVVCPMYPEIAAIREYGETGLGRRPLIMCEYSHAMGNSNGSLADYWDVIDATPGLQGGFLWEWKDHGLRQHLPDGTVRLAYGGQFGDTPHDGNFVADGLMAADLVPHPAARELMWVHRPVAVTAASDGLRVTNRTSFTDLAQFAGRWELMSEGEVVDAGGLVVPFIEPGSSATVALPEFSVTPPPGSGTSLVVRWYTRTDSWWSAAGRLVAWDQVILHDVAAPSPAPVPARSGSVALPELLLTPPRLNLWRAATDNDGFKLMADLAIRLNVGGRALRAWQDAGIDVSDADTLVDHRVTVTEDECGRSYHHLVDIPEHLADLARVGVTFTVPGHLGHMRWLGRGPHENYPDRNRSAMVACWDAPIDELPYLVPQEFGLRTDCRWFELRDPASGQGVRITALGPPLHVSATRHSPAELFAAAHVSELGRRDDVVVCVDVAHRGLGTASCGPDVLPEYRLPAGRYEFGYRLSGVQELT